MTVISTLDDPRVAEYRLLSDHAALVRAGLFVAEGRLVVRRLLSGANFKTRSVLVTAAACYAMRDLLDTASFDVFVADQQTMNRIAGFNIHRGCLALGERPPSRGLHDLPLATADRLVVLEGVNNPDNVGGIFRTAAAMGVDAVVLGPSCSDPLYRKSIRTSMAATLAVPFANAGGWPDALGTLHDTGFRVFALAPSPAAIALDRLPRDLARVAILVGAEGEGLSDGALAVADDRVRIPMHAAADSLNVTVAASIALHWFTRPAAR